MTMWPIIILVIWDNFLEESQNKHQSSLKSYSKQQEQGGGRKGPERAAANKDNEPKPPKVQKVCMQKDKPLNFLCLSATLKILCGRSVKLEMLHCAEELLQEYLFGYKKIRDYGPVYNFWAFLSEWLNKVVKGSNLNN
ncbi:hypothetical protein BU15DRAFT_67032 [Melanogaster broomeanus]|nr:hypothetical protein BU15DRAFT_68902 [Melanogaster broomeanus]KAF9232940.1 hypothetical protein BU15DRAFT_67032 [Melanogaster broomeanus]